VAVALRRTLLASLDDLLAVVLRPALQPAIPAIGPGRQTALADDEGLAQTQAAAVQGKAILPSGM